MNQFERAILERRVLPSASDPLQRYDMVRSAGGWQHADSGCTSWRIRNTCRHVEELNMETGLVPRETNALALIEELEDKAIIEAISGQITRTWVYDFNVSGQHVVGLSVDGVEEAAREMAKKGEAIREMDVRLEYEDEREARFVARAGRYAISSDGRELLLDVAIRAKRQSKLMKLQNGSIKEDEHWYEKGIAKAVRNAKEALLPESVKTYVIAEAVKAQRVRTAPQQAARQVQAPTPPASAAVDPNPACEHEAAFDEKSTLMVCKKCGVVLDEPPVTVGSSQSRMV